MTLSNLQKAEQDRQLLEDELKLVEEDIAEHEANTTIIKKHACSISVSKISELAVDLREIHKRILHTLPSEVTPHFTKFNNLSKRINSARAFLEDLNEQLNPAQPSSGSTSSPHLHSHSNLKLPKLDLPKFDGRYEDWQSFQDLFVATVQNNTSLSDAEKLSYLRSYVQGDAAQLIKSFTITNHHFKEAWDLLESRYNNKKEIVQSLVRKILNQPCVKTENATTLQQLLNTTNECLRGLKVLERDVDHWDDLIVVIIADKMDSDTRAEWAKAHRGTLPPTMKDLESFLIDHIRSLTARGYHSPQSKHTYPIQKQVSSHYIALQHKCGMCSQDHRIFQCEAFIKLSVNERNNIVKSKSLCFNCLRSGHSVRECRSSTCKLCSKPHNTLLHHDQPTPDAEKNTTSNFSGSSSTTQVILKTVKMKVTDQLGLEHVVRAVLDDGSQSSFITEACANALGLKKRRTNVRINGISGGAVTTATHMVNMVLKSRLNEDKINVEALVLPRVTTDLPAFSCNTSTWTHLSSLQLADPDYSRPGHIDVLLGADVTASIMRDGVIRGHANSPIAQNTIFGWVLSGRVPSNQPQSITSNVAMCDVETILTKFWEIEALPEKKHLSPEEQQCELHFQTTHTRNADGRYSVRLPFKRQTSELGSSREQAISRFHQLERRFRRQPLIKQQYSAFMNEYLSLCHMEIVPENEVSSHSYYLPHHFVLQKESTTTKLRVVFDGSASTSTGVSLNDILMVGPTVQDDLFTLLVRFRCNAIALKADIAKMYRQFRVPKVDADFQRILWRENEDEELKTYRLTTVTYGTASAPFTATRCLTQLAKDEALNFPAGSAVLSKDLYVDDLLSGAQTTAIAKELVNDLNSMTATAGMTFRKWATNDPHVLEDVPVECREKLSELDFDDNTTIKTLGVRWNPSDDTFRFKTADMTKVINKRTLLSELAKVFDPLGWLSPVTVRAKMLFQDLWKERLDWDEELPVDLHQKWTTYQCQLTAVQSIRIPRCVINMEAWELELHGFSDASEKAYSACVYLRVKGAANAVTSHLIAGKTKVSPIKQVSLPRLELCGATLLVDLLHLIQKAMNLRCTLHAWTDSTIVLQWLSSYPSRWETFVANRVSKIQEIVPAHQWSHVRSEENPADCASRGICADDLINHELWWEGPSWLKFTTIPASPFTPNTICKYEERKTTSLLTRPEEWDLFERYSTLPRLERITAYIMRFIHNSRSGTRRSGQLTPEELNLAFTALVKMCQYKHYSSELANLAKGNSIPSSSLNQLHPFIDAHGVLRVGGRLHHSNNSEEFKHPIIVPGSHSLTVLIVRHCHWKNLHSGLKLTLATLHQRFWIIRGRDVVRHLIRKCVICRKQRAEISQQLMGSLPRARVNPGRPFLQCGIDYAGPYLLKLKPGRGQRSIKCYFSIFVCLTTKAVHLELVRSLATDEFLACFKRFSSRRGIPSHMYSDCGTTFVGADKELKKLLNSSSHNLAFVRELAADGTTWSFNPPSAPHQGGLWEAGVKSVKYHLRRVIGKSEPSINEFETLLCLVEACLNSRPLCSMSNDPTDTTVLTPGHFLIGAPLNAVPEPDLTSTTTNRLSRWQQVQQQFQHFWKRWKGEYLTTLQQRFKWKTKRPNLQVGDLVIIKEENIPPMKWRLGRITEVHPGHDGSVRVAKVKAARGSEPGSTTEFLRPVAKLCPIITGNDD